MNGRRSKTPKSSRKITHDKKSADTTRIGVAQSDDQTTSRVSAKPIYSFFNSVAQRQRVIDPPPRIDRDSPAPVDTVVEAIHDESDEDVSHFERATSVLSTGSSVASAMRKRKSPIHLTLDDSVAPSASLPHKFRRTGDSSRVISEALNPDERPWTDRFAPVDLGELAVHKRKVADVRKWLENASKIRQQKLLVLKGPSGVGKTITLKLLAKDLDISLAEWRNSSSSDFALDENSPQSMRFDEFVNRAGRSAGLVLSVSSISAAPDVKMRDGDEHNPCQRQALLIEEFPATLSMTSNALQSFRTTVSRFLASRPQSAARSIPMIMIISETSTSANTTANDSFTAHRLLGVELSNHHCVDIIEFNPIAPTLMVKALELIVVKEARKSGRRKTPGLQVLQHLSEVGDIRSAVSALEFLCLRGDSGETWSDKVAFSKPRAAKARREMSKLEREALELISNRENSLGIFHSIGKIVYNKRTSLNDCHFPEPLPVWLQQYHRPDVPENDVNELFTDLGTDVMTFIAAIHENFLLSCRSSSSEQTLETMHGCLDSLSDADLLSLDRLSSSARMTSASVTDGLRQDELCFHAATRGVLFNLPSPVQRDRPTGGRPGDAHRMFYPVSNRLWRRQEETEDRLKSLRAQLDSTAEHKTNPLAGPKNKSYPSGVETWTRSSFKPTQTGDRDVTEETAGRKPTNSREELLFDRLPYMIQILGAKDLNTTFQAIFDLAVLVVRPSDDLPVASEEPPFDDELESSMLNGLATQETVAGARHNFASNESSTTRNTRTTRATVTASQPRTSSSEVDIQSLFLEDDDISDG